MKYCNLLHKPIKQIPNMQDTNKRNKCPHRFKCLSKQLKKLRCKHQTNL